MYKFFRARIAGLSFCIVCLSLNICYSDSGLRVCYKMDIGIYRKTPAAYKKQYLTSLVFNQLSVLPYLAGSITTLMIGEKGIYWIVPGIILSFIKAIIDAWVLLVEINS